MRGFVNLLLLFLAVANSNSQNFNLFDENIPQEYLHLYGKPDNVLQEEQFFYFDTDLLQALSIGEPHANIFISPLSIKTALTMILEGSANATEKEIKEALRLPDNKELIRKQFKELLNNFEDKKTGVTFKLANKIFVSNKLTPIQNYIEILRDYYFSDVTKVNFMNSKQSADTVNDWVEKETHGYISSIADQGTFSPDTSIFLANALYFKGIWLKSFSEQGTQTNCFYLFNGNCQKTPMMDVVDNFKYDEVKKLNAKVIELPYTGNEFSMVIILPNKKDGIHQLVRDIRTSINEIADKLTESEVYVTLPRFSIEYSTDLVKYLPSVNIKTISQPNADLSGLTAQVEGKISKMLHKARIEVNEEGTVAAAVTGAVVIPLMGVVKPRFRADHPFLFFIRHKQTKTILFEGRVMIPEKAVSQPPNPTQQRPQPANINNIYYTNTNEQQQQSQRHQTHQQQPQQQQLHQQQQQLHQQQQPLQQQQPHRQQQTHQQQQPHRQQQNPINLATQATQFPNNNNQFTSQPQQPAFAPQLNNQNAQNHQTRPQTQENLENQQYFQPSSNTAHMQIPKTTAEKLYFPEAQLG